MRRELEDELERRMRGGEAARDVVADMVGRGAIQSSKQALRTLEKWCRRGVYEYGVSLDLGWMSLKEPN